MSEAPRWRALRLTPGTIGTTTQVFSPTILLPKRSRRPFICLLPPVGNKAVPPDQRRREWTLDMSNSPVCNTSRRLSTRTIKTRSCYEERILLKRPEVRVRTCGGTGFKLFGNARYRWVIWWEGITESGLSGWKTVQKQHPFWTGLLQSSNRARARVTRASRTPIRREQQTPVGL